MAANNAMSDARRIEDEIARLRRELAELNRKRGPERVGDWTLAGPDGVPVKFSSLFGASNELLVIHNMGRRCVYCTMWADGINGLAEHLANRAPMVLISPDEPAVMREFAASRKWTFRTISCAGSSFAADLGFEDPPGSFHPGASGFRRCADGTIERTGVATFGPRDVYCAAWHLFDLLPNGAGSWSPKYSYSGQA
jgi:predicted dithiol-disulfide oxidoreductase (DUF899 family)